MEEIRIYCLVFRRGGCIRRSPVKTGIDCTGPVLIEDQRIDIKFAGLPTLKHPDSIFHALEYLFFIKRRSSTISLDEGITPQTSNHTLDIGTADREHSQ